MEIQEYNAKQYSSIRKRNPDYVVTLGNVLSDFAFLKKIEREYQIIPSLNSEITLFARLNDRNDAPIIPMNYAKGGVWL